jgi:hypothetical protein
MYNIKFTNKLIVLIQIILKINMIITIMKQNNILNIF